MRHLAFAGRGKANLLAWERFIPDKILMVVEEGKSKDEFLRRLPFLKGVGRINGQATAYVCSDYVCKLPTNDLGAFRDILDGKQPGAAW